MNVGSITIERPDTEHPAHVESGDNIHDGGCKCLWSINLCKMIGIVQLNNWSLQNTCEIPNHLLNWERRLIAHKQRDWHFDLLFQGLRCQVFSSSSCKFGEQGL